MPWHIGLNRIKHLESHIAYVVVTGASVADDYKIEPDENGQWLNEYKMKMRQGDINISYKRIIRRGGRGSGRHNHLKKPQQSSH